MPWSRNKGGGYSTPRGGNIENPRRYEALKRKFGKTKAAKITNGLAKRGK